MIRILILAAVVFAGSSLCASNSYAGEADCWRDIEAYKQETAELTKLTDHHRQTKTEEARCAMLAKTRALTLQKIEMSKACAPYVATAQADIAKAKETLKQLDSPQLKCPTAVSKPKSEEERCYFDLSLSRAAADDSIRVTRAYRASGSDADFCAMFPASARATAAARKAIKSCRRLYPEKMAEEQSGVEQLEALMKSQSAARAKRCASRPGKGA